MSAWSNYQTNNMHKQQPNNAWMQQPTSNNPWEQPGNEFSPQPPAFNNGWPENNGWSGQQPPFNSGYIQSNNGFVQPGSNNGFVQPNNGFSQPNKNNGWGQNNQGWGNQGIGAQIANNWGNQQPQQGNGKPADWRQHRGWGAIDPRFANNQQHSIVEGSLSKKKVKFDPSKLYTITTALSSSMVADISYQTGHLIIFNSQGNPNQKFRILEMSDGKFAIISEDSGNALEVKDNAPAIGAQIVASSSPNGAANQLWEIIECKQTQGNFYIKTFCGKCWDLTQCSSSAKTAIIQYDFNRGKNQEWIIKAV